MEEGRHGRKNFKMQNANLKFQIGFSRSVAVGGGAVDLFQPKDYFVEMGLVEAAPVEVEVVFGVGEFWRECFAGEV